ncbi:MAG: iron-containing alcohol dehydrogenase [Deltaproteobacteria bacterium]|nr:iron-containing alcohol dehydrogenase [Deltaproteobacteria bacterium]
MKNRYHISNTPELFLGCGSIHELYELFTRYKGPALIITGGSTRENISFLNGFLDRLSSENRLAGSVKIIHEPSPDDVDNAVEVYQDREIGCVISIGGGSVIDAGKAISAMLKSEGSINEYLEGVGSETPSGRKIPFIAVPTTAGTGSEATWNAVITRQGPNGFKKSLRHINFVPTIAVVDPELTVSCSPLTTAASGMDAFTQLVESYLSTHANPFTDALAFDAIGRLYGSLEQACRHGETLEARFEMTYAAYISGITLANAGLGLVHGFAQPLGSLFGIPHGVVCGTLMAAVNRVTARKLTRHGMKNSIAYKKYVEIGKLFAGSRAKRDDYYLDFCIHEMERLTEALQLPLLSTYGITEKDFDEIIAFTGLKYHPVQLNGEDLTTILKQRVGTKRPALPSSATAFDGQPNGSWRKERKN